MESVSRIHRVVAGRLRQPKSLGIGNSLFPSTKSLRSTVTVREPSIANAVLGRESRRNLITSEQRLESDDDQALDHRRSDSKRRCPGLTRGSAASSGSQLATSTR